MPNPPVELRSWRQRARGLYDRLPTKWLITGISAVLLAFSAALGGLDAVPAEPIPELEPGDSYEALQLTVTAERASLIDGFPEQLVMPDEGNRLLVVVATVENTWDEPVRITEVSGAADSLLPVGVDFAGDSTAPSRIIVFDDGSTVSTVQPNVPVRVAYVWEVPADELADGDELRVDILDRENQGEAAVYFGDRFSDFHVAAYVTFTVEDLGAGVSG
ncbi:hypothetical protein [Conyzicola sp.]|uniref:hypothetical protein n=1 Tax=Conyzicola sp. TaxID=1969404 RepID=UPI0039891EFC